MDVFTITTLAAELETVDPVAKSLHTVQVVSLLLGTLYPILVALVTKVDTSPAVRAVLLAALSAVSGFLTEFLNSENFVWQQALLTWVLTFVVAVATHFGLWQPTGVTAKAQRSLVK